MVDPVIDPDGHFYERAAILEWLEFNETSPINRGSLKAISLIPNRALKAILSAYPFSDLQILANFDNGEILRRGNHWYRQKDYEQALRWYRLSSSRGCTSSMLRIGLCLGEGQNDSPSVVEWYTKAANMGNSEAMCKLGHVSRSKQDYEEALVWYRKAADNGNATAMVYIGKYHEEGKVVMKDVFQAFKWFREAAWKGNADAMHYLGCCYEEGRGVQQSHAESQYWKEKAAIRDIYVIPD